MIPHSDVRLSIIVCTRNRARLLRLAVEGLLAQPFEPRFYEVLVVDGNSADGTPEMMRELVGRSPNVTYVNCPQRGLPSARVFGAARARGRVIGFLDDDAIADAGWLERADRIGRELDPICFGGPFFARYDTPKPDWFRDEYGSVTYGSVARPLRDDEFLCGGNIFFRRAALVEAGGFDAEFSRSTDAFSYGEETVPQVRLRRMFPEHAFYFDPELSILHLVRPERMSVRRGVRETFELGRGYGKLVLAGRSETRRLPFLRRLIQRLVAFGLQAAFCTPFRDRKKFPRWQNYIYEHAAQQMRGAGMYYEHYLSAVRSSRRSVATK